MPTYDYICECGATLSRVLPMSQCDATMSCTRCGKRMQRDYATEQAGNKGKRTKTWPMKSDAAGVHPSQIASETERAGKMGIPTEFTPDGRAIFTGPKHRQRYCEAIGMFDRNGGYSDPQRGKAKDRQLQED